MYRILAILIFVFSPSAYAGLLDDVRKEHSDRLQTARFVAELIRSADVARVRGEMEAESAGVVVRDIGWIRRLSHALTEVRLGEPVGCLCSGWQTAYFYREGKFLASIAAIHGNQLRIFWTGGGGDYPIDEASWRAVKAALEYREK